MIFPALGFTLRIFIFQMARETTGENSFVAAIHNS